MVFSILEDMMGVRWRGKIEGEEEQRSGSLGGEGGGEKM
jgi:hypothetical protein